jgi:hypothetical protein
MYLANTLGVPMRPLHSISSDHPRSPLLSIKSDEFGDTFPIFIDSIVSSGMNFSLFLHDFQGSHLETALATRAQSVIAANQVIAERLFSQGVNATAAFCPGMPPLPRSSTARINVLTFGMAHKIRAASYQKLHQLLENSGETYQVRVSSALHEETHLEQALFTLSSDMYQLFGSSLTFLGFLSDELISQELSSATFFAAFFTNGARENNTSVMTAMAHGTPVITRLDQDSPPFMVHGKTVFDINQMQKLPDALERQSVGLHGQEVVRELNFEALSKLLTCPLTSPSTSE